MNHPHRRGFTFVDLVVVLTLLVFAFAVALPRLTSNARETSNRVRCAANMKSIGNAMLLYANENNGNYPRTRYDRTHATPTQYTGSAAPNPFGPGGPANNDVTACFYLLIRGDYSSSSVYVCPSDSGGSPFTGNGIPLNSLSNFPDNKGLSYSIQNAYADDAALADGFRWKNTLSSDFAVAADMNPGTPAVLAATTQMSLQQMQLANSPNHGGVGQEVLFGDGHVDFFQTPFVGVAMDNIYGVGKRSKPPQYTIDPRAYSISGSPGHANDSVLLPTYVGSARQFAKPSIDSPTIVMIVIVALFLAAAVFLAIYAMRDRKPRAEALA